MTDKMTAPGNPLVITLRRVPLLGRFLLRPQLVAYGPGVYRLTIVAVTSCPHVL